MSGEGQGVVVEQVGGEGRDQRRPGRIARRAGGDCMQLFSRIVMGDWPSRFQENRPDGVGDDARVIATPKSQPAFTDVEIRQRSTPPSRNPSPLRAK